MAIHRTRQNKENPHYSFLVSWEPGKMSSQAHVKREGKIAPEAKLANLSVKKDIFRSLILISFMLALEVVVYLAWNKYF